MKCIRRWGKMLYLLLPVIPARQYGIWMIKVTKRGQFEVFLQRDSGSTSALDGGWSSSHQEKQEPDDHVTCLGKVNMSNRGSQVGSTSVMSP